MSIFVSLFFNYVFNILDRLSENKLHYELIHFVSSTMFPPWFFSEFLCTNFGLKLVLNDGRVCVNHWFFTLSKLFVRSIIFSYTCFNQLHLNQFQRMRIRLGFWRLGDLLCGLKSGSRNERQYLDGTLQSPLCVREIWSPPTYHYYVRYNSFIPHKRILGWRVSGSPNLT